MVDCYLQKLSNRPVGADDRATLFEIARWVTVGTLFVCLILVYAWSQNEIVSIRYHMEQIKKESDELPAATAALRAEYSSRINPESIAIRAMELGFVASNSAEVIILDSTRRDVQSSERILAQSNLQKKTVHE